MLKKLHKAELNFRLTSDIINVYPNTAGAKVKLIAFRGTTLRASVDAIAVLEGVQTDTKANQEALEKAIAKAVKLVIQLDKKLAETHAVGIDLVFQGTGEAVIKNLRAKGIIRVGQNDKEAYYAELTEFMPASIENVDAIQDLLTKKLLDLIDL